MNRESAIKIPLIARLCRRLKPPFHTIAGSNRTKRGVLSGLVVLLILVCTLSLCVGAVTIAPGQVIAIIGEMVGLELPFYFTSGQQAVLQSIRAPRVVLGVLVGSALAVSGAALQGLFRNPLADPALIGVSSGAALGAVTVIVLESSLLKGFSQWTGRYSLPIAAFAGGLIATWLAYRFASVKGRLEITSLLLAGIAINALSGSMTGLMIYLADDQQLRTLIFWSMGSLGGASWSGILTGAPFFLIPMVSIPFLSRALNALLLGEAEAGHLGFAVDRIKTAVILLAALSVGAAVSAAGMIGFIGLVVPHLLRLGFGPDHRLLLPGSAVLGAILLLVADLLARKLLVPAEIPIGIITGMLGGPFFLWLLRRQTIAGGW
ncbi:MAG: FecCD family ABC transporter permease [Methylococcales bacterium]